MEKFYEIWKPILKSFMQAYPDKYEDMVDWYPSGCMEINVKLRDGKRMTYDMIDDRLDVAYDPREQRRCDDEAAWRNNFARLLNNRMRKLGMSQERLSDETGISRVTINKYISGKASPSGYNIERLSIALRCSPTELIGIR